MTHCLTLPDHESSEQEIQDMLKGLRDFLQPTTNDPPPPPCLVTIARSSDDGYTPATVVDWLEEQVVNLIKEVYGQGVEVVRHVGEEQEEEDERPTK